jgi:hypothetical protein
MADGFDLFPRVIPCEPYVGNYSTRFSRMSEISSNPFLPFKIDKSIPSESAVIP